MRSWRAYEVSWERLFVHVLGGEVEKGTSWQAGRPRPAGDGRFPMGGKQFITEEKRKGKGGKFRL